MHSERWTLTTLCFVFFEYFCLQIQIINFVTNPWYNHNEEWKTFRRKITSCKIDAETLNVQSLLRLLQKSNCNTTQFLTVSYLNHINSYINQVVYTRETILFYYKFENWFLFDFLLHRFNFTSVPRLNWFVFYGIQTCLMFPKNSITNTGLN